MQDKQNLDPEDVSLFRQSVGEVIAIKQDTVMPEKPRIVRKTSPSPRSENKQHSNYFQEFIPEEFRVSASDPIQFKRAGLQDKVFRKLKRGQLPIVDKLDLHGMTAYKAKQALDSFLGEAKGFTTQSCFIVIHGKGYGSKDGMPKLKQYLQTWLQEDRNVLAYSSCAPKDGGTGAIYLLLKGGRN